MDYNDNINNNNEQSQETPKKKSRFTINLALFFVLTIFVFVLGLGLFSGDLVFTKYRKKVESTDFKAVLVNKDHNKIFDIKELKDGNPEEYKNLNYKIGSINFNPDSSDFNNFTISQFLKTSASDTSFDLYSEIKKRNTKTKKDEITTKNEGKSFSIFNIYKKMLEIENLKDGSSVSFYLLSKFGYKIIRYDLKIIKSNFIPIYYGKTEDLNNLVGIMPKKEQFANLDSYEGLTDFIKTRVYDKQENIFINGIDQAFYLKVSKGTDFDYLSVNHDNINSEITRSSGKYFALCISDLANNPEYAKVSFEPYFYKDQNAIEKENIVKEIFFIKKNTQIKDGLFTISSDNKINHQDSFFNSETNLKKLFDDRYKSKIKSEYQNLNSSYEANRWFYDGNEILKIDSVISSNIVLIQDYIKDKVSFTIYKLNKENQLEKINELNKQKSTCNETCKNNYNNLVNTVTNNFKNQHLKLNKLKLVKIKIEKGNIFLDEILSEDDFSSQVVVGEIINYGKDVFLLADLTGYIELEFRVFGRNDYFQKEYIEPNTNFQTPKMQKQFIISNGFDTSEKFNVLYWENDNLGLIKAGESKNFANDKPEIKKITLTGRADKIPVAFNYDLLNLDPIKQFKRYITINENEVKQDYIVLNHQFLTKNGEEDFFVISGDKTRYPYTLGLNKNKKLMFNWNENYLEHEIELKLRQYEITINYNVRDFNFETNSEIFQQKVLNKFIINYNDDLDSEITNYLNSKNININSQRTYELIGYSFNQNSDKYINGSESIDLKKFSNRPIDDIKLKTITLYAKYKKIQKTNYVFEYFYYDKGNKIFTEKIEVSNTINIGSKATLSNLKNFSKRNYQDNNYSLYNFFSSKTNLENNTIPINNEIEITEDKQIIFMQMVAPLKLKLKMQDETGNYRINAYTFNYEYNSTSNKINLKIDELKPKEFNSGNKIKKLILNRISKPNYEFIASSSNNIDINKPFDFDEFGKEYETLIEWENAIFEIEAYFGDELIGSKIETINNLAESINLAEKLNLNKKQNSPYNAYYINSVKLNNISKDINLDLDLLKYKRNIIKVDLKQKEYTISFSVKTPNGNLKSSSIILKENDLLKNELNNIEFITRYFRKNARGYVVSNWSNFKITKVNGHDISLSTANQYYDLLNNPKFNISNLHYHPSGIISNHDYIKEIETGKKYQITLKTEPTEAKQDFKIKFLYKEDFKQATLTADNFNFQYDISLNYNELDTFNYQNQQIKNFIKRQKNEANRSYQLYLKNPDGIFSKIWSFGSNDNLGDLKDKTIIENSGEEVLELYFFFEKAVRLNFSFKNANNQLQTFTNFAFEDDNIDVSELKTILNNNNQLNENLSVVQSDGNISQVKNEILNFKIEGVLSNSINVKPNLNGKTYELELKYVSLNLIVKYEYASHNKDNVLENEKNILIFRSKNTAIKFIETIDYVSISSGASYYNFSNLNANSSNFNQNIGLDTNELRLEYKLKTHKLTFSTASGQSYENPENLPLEYHIPYGVKPSFKVKKVLYAIHRTYNNFKTNKYALVNSNIAPEFSFENILNSDVTIYPKFKAKFKIEIFDKDNNNIFTKANHSFTDKFTLPANSNLNNTASLELIDYIIFNEATNSISKIYQIGEQINVFENLKLYARFKKQKLNYEINLINNTNDIKNGNESFTASDNFNFQKGKLNYFINPTTSILKNLNLKLYFKSLFDNSAANNNVYSYSGKEYRLYEIKMLTNNGLISIWSYGNSFTLTDDLTNKTLDNGLNEKLVLYFLFKEKTNIKFDLNGELITKQFFPNENLDLINLNNLFNDKLIITDGKTILDNQAIINLAKNEIIKINNANTNLIVNEKDNNTYTLNLKYIKLELNFKYEAIINDKLAENKVLRQILYLDIDKNISLDNTFNFLNDTNFIKANSNLITSISLNKNKLSYELVYKLKTYKLQFDMQDNKYRYKNNTYTSSKPLEFNIPYGITTLSFIGEIPKASKDIFESSIYLINGTNNIFDFENILLSNTVITPKYVKNVFVEFKLENGTLIRKVEHLVGNNLTLPEFNEFNNLGYGKLINYKYNNNLKNENEIISDIKNNTIITLIYEKSKRVIIKIDSKDYREYSFLKQSFIDNLNLISKKEYYKNDFIILNPEFTSERNDQSIDIIQEYLINSSFISNLSNNKFKVITNTEDDLEINLILKPHLKIKLIEIDKLTNETINKIENIFITNQDSFILNESNYQIANFKFDFAEYQNLKFENPFDNKLIDIIKDKSSNTILNFDKLNYLNLYYISEERLKDVDIRVDFYIQKLDNTITNNKFSNYEFYAKSEFKNSTGLNIIDIETLAKLNNLSPDVNYNDLIKNTLSHFDTDNFIIDINDVIYYPAGGNSTSDTYYKVKVSKDRKVVLAVFLNRKKININFKFITQYNNLNDYTRGNIQAGIYKYNDLKKLFNLDPTLGYENHTISKISFFAQNNPSNGQILISENDNNININGQINETIYIKLEFQNDQFYRITFKLITDENFINPYFNSDHIFLRRNLNVSYAFFGLDGNIKLDSPFLQNIKHPTKKYLTFLGYTLDKNSVNLINEHYTVGSDVVFYLIFKGKVNVDFYLRKQEIQINPNDLLYERYLNASGREGDLKVMETFHKKINIFEKDIIQGKLTNYNGKTPLNLLSLNSSDGNEFLGEFNNVYPTGSKKLLYVQFTDDIYTTGSVSTGESYDYFPSKYYLTFKDTFRYFEIGDHNLSINYFVTDDSEYINDKPIKVIITNNFVFKMNPNQEFEDTFIEYKNKKYKYDFLINNDSRQTYYSQSYSLGLGELPKYNRKNKFSKIKITRIISKTKEEVIYDRINPNDFYATTGISLITYLR